MRKVLSAALAAALLLTGCWDSYPIERLGFVPFVAVDRDPSGLLHFYGHIIDPPSLPSGQGGGSPSGQQTFTMTQGTGRTTFEAIKEAEMASPKRLFFGPIEDIILSERAARAGDLPKVLDFFARGMKSRDIPWVWVAPDKQFPEIINSPKQGASYPAAALDNLAQIVREESTVRSRRVFEVLSDLATPSHTSTVPLLTIEKGHFATESMAVLRNAKMIGTLDRPAAHGYSLVAENSRRTPIVVPCPGGAISLETTGNSKKVHAIRQNGQLIGYRISINSLMRVTENAGCNVNLVHEQDYDQLAHMASTVLLEKALTVLKAAQSLHADIFNLVRWSGMAPKDYETLGDQWSDQVFPKLQFVVEVNSTIKTTGILNLHRLQINDPSLKPSTSRPPQGA